MKYYRQFLFDAVKQLTRGGAYYYPWMALLSLLVVGGVVSYGYQLTSGLAVTGMSDEVSWGIYIANFTFLVGVAAAAVMLVIPAYLFKIEPVHRVVFIGELLAVSAIVMCLLFVTVDLGRPERFLHLLKRFNWPISMLSWDVLVLNGYLVLNVHISGYLLFQRYTGRAVNKKMYLPFVFLSIAWAVSVHTVTAFLYAGLGGRPFWNSAVLGPRFLASAFTAGPALLIIVFQLVRRLSSFDVSESVIRLLSRVMLVCMTINLFLLACEVFTEFYTNSEHAVSAHYLFLGAHGHSKLVPWIWTAVFLNVTAWIVLMVNPLRRNRPALNVACVITVVGIWIEKGMGLIVPGFIPTPLGEWKEYGITLPEIGVCVGIWALGALIYTCLLKVALPVESGSLRHPEVRAT